MYFKGQRNTWNYKQELNDGEFILWKYMDDSIPNPVKQDYNVTIKYNHQGRLKL
jgi:hypothetical protein